MGGRRWTVKEDSALRFRVALARDWRQDTGGRPRRGWTGILRAVARDLDRSDAAVRKRACRLGLRVRPMSHCDEKS